MRPDITRHIDAPGKEFQHAGAWCLGRKWYTVVGKRHLAAVAFGFYIFFFIPSGRIIKPQNAISEETFCCERLL